jgi:transcriptional regulator with XRE-family HTH domain
MLLLEGDALDKLAELPDSSVDACVTDPPYGLAFMSKAWDHGVPGEPYWREVYRVLRPGGHLAAFGGTRTFHRLTCAIEDAGFEIRDCLMFLHGQGFPKSLDVSKAIDKRGGANIAWFGPWLRQERERRGMAQKELAKHFPSKTGGLTGCVANWELGLNLPTVEQFNTLCAVMDLPFTRLEEAEREVVGERTKAESFKHKGNNVYQTGGDQDRVVIQETSPTTDAAKQWEGWGTALKPAWEPIVLARKPLAGTVAQNVLANGTGGLNIDGCRIHTAGSEGVEYTVRRLNPGASVDKTGKWKQDVEYRGKTADGRWPANVVLDEDAAALLDAQSGGRKSGGRVRGTEPSAVTNNAYGDFAGRVPYEPICDTGGASRFFYCAKASPAERRPYNDHPTVKPLALMQWLVKLVTPPGGTVLDPFMGSGSTLIAARREGFAAIGIDKDPHSVEIARRRLDDDAPAVAVPDSLAAPIQASLFEVPA